MGKQSFGVISATDPTDDLQIVNVVHGAFPGSVTPAARIEALIAAHVPKIHIKDVAAVYGARWWDYRRLTPGHSFMLFAHTYYSAFKISARLFLAHRKRQRVAGINVPEAIVGPRETEYTADDIWDRDQGHITGMWKAMLTADALGIPYDQFCRLAFNHATEKLWTRLPKPTQLYNDEVGARVLIEWDKRQEERVFFAKHPLYSVEHYAGSELQDDYRAWLKDQLLTRDNPVPAIVNALYTRPQLEEADLKGLFPANTLNRARLIGS